MSSPSVRRRVRLLVCAFGMLAIAIGVTANLGPKRASALSEDVDKHQGEISGAVEFAKRPDIQVDQPGDHQEGGRLRNILVNQDHSDFPHDETAIAVNPRNRNNLVAGANDYRLGYGSSGFYSSQDGGRTWYDGIIPVPSWPDGDVPAGGGDPVTLFDSNGIAYYIGLAFDRASDRSAIVVSRSTNAGVTWSRPSFSTKDGVAVANLKRVDPSVFHDKEWGAIDVTTGKANSHPNRLYITWTRFEAAPLAAASPIYEVHSDDGARTFSAPHEISGASKLCDYQTGGTVARRCGDNQPSWPVVGPDGTVYVFFRNQDTPAENQFLMVKSTDGGVSFGDPVKVADDFDVNYPTGRTTRPDCVARGQGSTRRVLSNSCFRVNSYGGPAVAPDGRCTWSGPIIATATMCTPTGTSSSQSHLTAARAGVMPFESTRIRSATVRISSSPGRRWLPTERSTSSSMTAVSTPPQPLRHTASQSIRRATTWSIPGSRGQATAASVGTISASATFLRTLTSASAVGSSSAITAGWRPHGISPTHSLPTRATVLPLSVTPTSI